MKLSGELHASAHFKCARNKLFWFDLLPLDLLLADDSGLHELPSADVAPVDEKSVYPTVSRCYMRESLARQSRPRSASRDPALGRPHLVGASVQAIPQQKVLW